MYALYDEQRQRLLRLSLMLICGGLAVAPLTVPPSSVEARAQSAPRHAQLLMPVVPGRLQFPVIAVQRDPFVADASAFPVSDVPNGDLAIHGGDGIGIVLPPNAGAAGSVPQEGGAAVPIVRGVVLGQEPQALIDTGSGVKVFGIGDAVGNQSIRSIDAGGVLLSNGSALKIASPQQ